MPVNSDDLEQETKKISAVYKTINY